MKIKLVKKWVPLAISIDFWYSLTTWVLRINGLLDAYLIVSSLSLHKPQLYICLHVNILPK